MMQVSSNSYYKTYKEFKLQTVKDNLMLLDDETIMEINELVVETAHGLVLKKNEKIQIKSVTYVLETNVHFPTDYNLLLDAGNTSLNIMKKCLILHDFEGW